MNVTLYKRGLRGSWKQLALFAAVLTMYCTVIISMFDPKLGSALNSLAAALPQLMAAVGMTPGSNTLIGFMSAYLYGFVMLIFPMVFSMLCANQLVARHVDRGSMAYLLSAPVRRPRVIRTQIAVIVSGIIALVVFATILSIITCEAFFPGELDIGAFLTLNFGLLCLHLCIGGICFLCSCAFSDAKRSAAFGAGLPALAFILQMVANAGGEWENAKYLTFFTLFRPDGIAAYEPGAIGGIIALLIGALILFASSVIVFSRKDLHI